MRRHESFVDRVRAQRRPDRSFLHRRHRGRQRAGTQVARQVLGFLFAAQVGDPSGIFDPGLDGGYADDLVVQHHRQLVADVVFGEIAEPAPAIRRQREAGFPLPVLVLAGVSVAHLAAHDHRRTPQQVPLFARRGAARLGLGPACCSAAARRHAAPAPPRGWGTARPSLRRSPAPPPCRSVLFTRAGSSTPGNCTSTS